MDGPQTPQPNDADSAPAGPGTAGLSRKARMRASFEVSELVIDKFVDFILIFVGLCAAIAVQRWQDTDEEKDQYVALLKDFKTGLAANLAQEASIEKVADVEATYNDVFMVQLGRSAATDSELAEIVHEEEVHGLSPQNQQVLCQILHNVKDERYAAKEAKSVVELEVERMKTTALLLREEIAEVQKAIDAELAKVEG